MEFKSLKNIESSFRQIRLFGVVFVSLCAVVAVAAVVLSLNFAEKQGQRILPVGGGDFKSIVLRV